MPNTMMPEPVAWLAASGAAAGFKTPLITTDQAEAYAAAKVREAMEEAAQACEARIGQHAVGMKPEDVEDCDQEARECAAAIRALIPQQ